MDTIYGPSVPWVSAKKSTVGLTGFPCNQYSPFTVFGVCILSLPLEAWVTVRFVVQKEWVGRVTEHWAEPVTAETRDSSTLTRGKLTFRSRQIVLKEDTPKVKTKPQSSSGWRTERAKWNLYGASSALTTRKPATSLTPFISGKS